MTLCAFVRTHVHVCACLLSLPLLCTAGCHRLETAEVSETAVAPVAVAARATLQNTLEVAGEFLPFQEVELHAKVAGYIRHISVDIGDHVRTGQVLATLDVPELLAQVQGASAGVRQSQQQITRAKSEVLRAQANYEALHTSAQRLQAASAAQPGLIARQELDNALAQDRSGAAQVDAAKAALSATEQQLGVSQADRSRMTSMADYSRIVAPFSGVITQRYADTGTLIQAGTSGAGAPVVKLAQISTLRLRLPVPESLAGFIKLGQTAQIRVGALGKTFAGEVKRNSASLDPATRTMQVEIDVPNATGEITPGMYAQVSLAVQRGGDALAVPVQAVDRSGAQPFVMLVDGSNHVQKRQVEVGIATPNQVEILGGITDGDKVITANLATYQSGEVVMPKISAMADAKGDQ